MPHISLHATSSVCAEPSPTPRVLATWSEQVGWGDWKQNIFIWVSSMGQQVWTKVYHRVPEFHWGPLGFPLRIKRGFVHFTFLFGQNRQRHYGERPVQGLLGGEGGKTGKAGQASVGEVFFSQLISFYWGIINMKQYIRFRSTMKWFDSCVCCKMIATV